MLCRVSCVPGSCPNPGENEPRPEPFEPGTEIKFQDSDEVSSVLSSVLMMPRQDRLLRCLRESEALLRKAKSECAGGDAREIDFLLRMTVRVISNSVNSVERVDNTVEDEKDAVFESAFSDESAKDTEEHEPPSPEQEPAPAPVKEEVDGDSDDASVEHSPPVAAMGLALLVSATVVVPYVLMMLAAIFGAAMAVAEKWSIWAGFLYVASNVTGLGSMLTRTTPPTTRAGKLIDIVVSAWVIVFGSAAVGAISNLRVMKQLRAVLPLEGARGLLVILLLLPGLVVLAAVGMAVALTKLEDGWSKPAAFRFMISAMCGLGNPLTNQVPETAWGKLFAAGCASCQMAIGGTLVGLTGAIPRLNKIIQFVEYWCLECCCCYARPQPRVPPPKSRSQQQPTRQAPAIAEEEAEARDVRNV